MLSFKQYIIESLNNVWWHVNEIYRQEGVHHNISIGKLKSIARDSLSSQSRFCYEEGGKLHGADAYWHEHADITGGYRSSEVEGFIHHDQESNTHYYEVYPANRRVNMSDHPIIKKFQKAGMKEYKQDDIVL